MSCQGWGKRWSRHRWVLDPRWGKVCSRCGADTEEERRLNRGKEDISMDMTCPLVEKRKGFCSWKPCGKPLPKKRRNWCSDECRNRWWENHIWDAARKACLKRHPYCECGAKAQEVHHRIPTDTYFKSCNHHSEDLQSECRPCHERTHHPPKVAEVRKLLRVEPELQGVLL